MRVAGTLWVTVVLMTGSLLPSPARAALVGYEFAGAIIQAGDAALAAALPVGAVVTGSFVVDDARADVNLALPQSGLYADAFVSSTTAFGGYAISTSGGAVAVGDDNPGDIVSLVAGPAFGLGGSVTGAAIGDFVLESWNFQLGDSTGAALGSDAFPTSADFTGLAAYDSRLLSLVFRNTGTGAVAFAQAGIDLIARPTVVVPAPPAALLLFAGLGALRRARRFRCRRACCRPSPGPAGGDADAWR